MKLIITDHVEKMLKRIGFSLMDFVSFLESNDFWNTKLIEICSPIEDTIVYKAYMSDLDRGIIFLVKTKGILYPVYVGNKNDPITRNITVAQVRKYAESWQDLFLSDIEAKKYKIRHY